MGACSLARQCQQPLLKRSLLKRSLLNLLDRQKFEDEQMWARRLRARGRCSILNVKTTHAHMPAYCKEPEKPRSTTQRYRHMPKKHSEYPSKVISSL
mmetsp:Transcript_39518/g.74154  ORF Transcript_39518/g.74154 Transcript_39518/m.74154 type:complete len:97 (-) Transcript_39518:265-555(-)